MLGTDPLEVGNPLSITADRSLPRFEFEVATGINARFNGPLLEITVAGEYGQLQLTLESSRDLRSGWTAESPMAISDHLFRTLSRSDSDKGGFFRLRVGP